MNGGCGGVMHLLLGVSEGHWGRGGISKSSKSSSCGDLSILIGVGTICVACVSGGVCVSLVGRGRGNGGITTG